MITQFKIFESSSSLYCYARSFVPEDITEIYEKIKKLNIKYSLYVIGDFDTNHVIVLYIYTDEHTHEEYFRDFFFQSDEERTVLGREKMDFDEYLLTMVTNKYNL